MTSPGTSVAITPEIEALLAADAAEAAAPEAVVDTAMDVTLAAGNAPSPPRPKFDAALPPHLELFGDVTAAPAADLSPMPLATSVDLLIQAMASLPPAAADGYVSAPSNDRTWAMPPIAVGA